MPLIPGCKSTLFLAQNCTALSTQLADFAEKCALCNIRNLNPSEGHVNGTRYVVDEWVPVTGGWARRVSPGR